MAGSVKIRKDLTRKLQGLSDFIKNGICAGVLPLDEAHRAEEQFKEWFSQYMQVTEIVRDNHAYWQETEKIAKVDKETKDMEDLVGFNFKAISKYVLSTAYTTSRLSATMTEDPRVDTDQTYVMELPPPPAELMKTVVKSPGTDPEKEHLKQQVEELKAQQSRMEQLLESMHVSPKGLEEHHTSFTPKKKLEFRVDDQKEKKPGLSPMASSTPFDSHIQDKNTEMGRYETDFDDASSEDMYINASFIQHNPQLRIGLPLSANLRNTGVRDTKELRMKTDAELLHDSLSEYIHKKQAFPVHASGFRPNESDQEDPTRFLTRIPLPKFDGTKKKFESWWAAFQAVVDASGASDGVKMLKLYDSVTGIALDAIEGLGYSPMAYQMAKEKLERKFGGGRRRMAIRWEEVSEFRPMKEDSAENMERFSEMVDRLVLSLCEQEENAELGSGTLYHALQKKLTPTCLSRYQRWLFENSKSGNVVTLREFVSQEALFLVTATEAVQGVSTGRKSKQGKEKGGSSFASVSKNERKNGSEKTAKNMKKWKCKVCESEHGLWQCARFLRLTIDQRWDKVAEIKACEKCLQCTHITDKCYRRKGCTVEGCKETHHYLLHRKPGEYRHSDKTPSHKTDKTDQKPSASGEKQKKDVSTDTTCLAPTDSSSFHISDKSFLFFRTVPVYLCSGGRTLKVNALLDDASDKSYITEEAASVLHLQGQETTAAVGSINDGQTIVKSQEVTCELRSLDGDQSRILIARTLPSISSNIRAVKVNDYKNRWEHLRDIDFPDPVGHKIDILLGLDYADLMNSRDGDIKGKKSGDPIARRTPLGWTCIGTSYHNEVSQTFISCSFHGKQIDYETNDMLKKFWEIDNVSETKVVNLDDKKALDIVKKSLRYENGRYTVGLPWKSDERPDNNYESALKQFLSTEKRLEKTPDVKKQYHDVFTGYKQQTYVRKCQASARYDKKCCILGHFPVIREHVETTKVRPVMNAASKHKGRSLNDYLLVGPKLQNDLVAILLRFRRNPVGVSSDVAQMYLQIFVQECDRPYQRFLLRNPDTGEIEIWEFTRVVFGMNCSPFLAQFVVQEHAKQFITSQPDGAEMIINSTYVDDGLDSAESEQKGIVKIQETKDIYGGCGMSIHKWLSNSPRALSQLANEELGKNVDLAMMFLPQAKTLGQGWDPMEDNLNFKAIHVDHELVRTKRLFLKTLASMFDPLGLAAPILIKGKMILQRCWESGVDWDDVLPDKILHDIKQWLFEVHVLDRVSVPRVLVRDSSADIQIHVCSDASNDAYGAVLYLKNWIAGQTPWINIVMSKAKVAPLTCVCTPRMELMAATMGANLAETACKALKVSRERCFFWTDSQDVLYWVLGHSKDFKPFVANRVGEIQRLTEPTNWKYIKGQENPADILSRGAEGSTFPQNTMWWKGPDFLLLEQENWPDWKPQVKPSALKERKKASGITMVVTAGNSEIEVQKDIVLENTRLAPERYSSWERLVGVFAYVLRAMNVLRDKHRVHDRSLTKDEMIEAETCLIRYAQQQSYAQEIHDLKKGLPVLCKSEVSALEPWLDESGLLRGKTRLERSEETSWDVRYPILLSRKHWITVLIARKYHEEQGHCGSGNIATELMKRFWIIGIRILTRQVKADCMRCRRMHAKALQPKMGALPPERIDYAGVVFTVISTDFCGPFYTMAGRGRPRYKRYVCLFSCMHTRAVHLEVVFDMTTSGFLMAFTRFVDKRGTPSIVISDNGSNYVGGDREMKELWDRFDEEEIKDKTKVRRVVWKFNPPAAPHFNGVHEILIKAVKQAMYRVFTGANIRDEELITVVSNVESMMNSRPITVRSNDPADPRPLTPFHLITGRMMVPLVHQKINFDEDVQWRWRHVEHLSGQIWRRWHLEWLTSLSPRSKWKKQGRDLKVGDVVLVVEKEVPRYQWNLGRVLQVYPGVDGIVRVVDVQVGPTVYRRPAVKLSFLTD